MGDDGALGENNKKSPFLKDKPSGTLPKREIADSLLLNFPRKLKDQIDKVKKSR